MSAENSTLWIEKYRPQTLSAVVHHDEVRAMLRQAQLSGSLPHLIFYGPAGTGKTSTILAFAKDVFGAKQWRDRVLELNASDERGIDMIRDRVKTWSKLLVNHNSLDAKVADMDDGPASIANYKILVLDEGDMLTVDAQSALRRIIEDTSKNTRFVIICNYVSKIIDAVVSRCVTYRFQPIPKSAQRERILEICQAEKVDITNDGVDELLRISRGDLRHAINLLQSTVVEGRKVTEEVVLRAAGHPPLRVAQDMWELMKAQTIFDRLYSQVESVLGEGWDISIIISQLQRLLVQDENLSDVTKAQIAPVIAKCSRRLVDGASERLLLLHLASQISGKMAKSR